MIGNRILTTLIFFLAFPVGNTQESLAVTATSQKILGSSVSGEIYLDGNKYTDGSQRLTIDPDTGVMEPQKRINGIWQPGPFEVGPDTLWIGKNIGWAAAGHHVIVEDAGGGFHSYVHSQFDGEISTSDSKTLYAYYFSERQISQADDSNEWSGTAFSWAEPSSIHGLLKKGYWKTGSIAATKSIRIRTWEGADENGTLVFDQYYPAVDFAANIEIATNEDGFIELEPGLTYFTEISSENTFSLLTNAEESKPWNAIDLILIRHDNLLQTTEWVDGGTYTEGQYFITNRQIYICNTTGAQTGTFEDNSALWDELSGRYIEGKFTDGAIPFADSIGKLTEDPTNFFYDAQHYLHTPKLAIFDDDLIAKRGHGLAIIRGADPDVDIVHANTQSTSAYFRYDFSEDMFWFDKGLRIKAWGTDEADLNIEKGKLIVNAIEIVGIDGEVNKAAIEDSENWDTAYGWGDHALVGYLTSESDPVFSAWDKSTGISITESQISDLQSYLVAETDPIFTAWDKSSGISITESQISDLNHFNGAAGNLSGTIQYRVPFGNASGGLTDSPNLTYSDSALRVSNGGIYLDRSGADSFIAFKRSGTQVGQIRGTDGSIDITESGGSPVHFSVDVVSGITSMTGVDTSKIGNSAGILKLNPDATGIVELFGDADVDNSENGKMLYVWRRAPEGDDYIRLYVNHDTTGIISAGAGLTVYGEGSVTLQSGTENVIFRVGDDAGAKGTYFKNSSNDIVGSVDSLGNAQFNVSIDVPEFSNTTGLLKIQPDVQGDVELFGDTDVLDSENSKIFKVWRRASEGNDYIRMYISASRNAFIHASNNLTLQAQVPFTINSVTDDIIFKVGDNAGSKKFRFKDSDGNLVASIDSNGNMGIGPYTPSARLEISNTIIHDNYKALSFSDAGDDTYYFYANYAGTGQTGNWVTFSDVWGNDIQTWRDGNVGIGTTDPNYALHLYRTDEHSVLQVEANGPNHGEANIFLKTQSDPGWQVFMDDSNLSVLGEADRLGFFHYGSAITRMVIDGSSGNVGIGTTDPKEELHLKSDHPTIAFEEADGSSNEKVWEFGASGDEFLFRTANDLHTGNQTIFKAMNRGGTSVSAFVIPNAKVGVGTEIISGELTIDQSNASGAISVLTLDQGDVDEPFIEFLNGTVLAGKSGLNEYLEVKVGSNTRHLRLFN